MSEINRISSVESGDPVRILRMAWFHLGTQSWHHSPHADLQQCHDLLSDKLRECQRIEEHIEVEAVQPKPGQRAGRGRKKAPCPQKQT